MRGKLLRHHSLMTHLSLRCLRSCKVDVQPTVTNNKRPLCLIYQHDSAVIAFTDISSPELLILLLRVGNSSASAHSCRVQVDKTLCWFTAGARGAIWVVLHKSHNRCAGRCKYLSPNLWINWKHAPVNQMPVGGVSFIHNRGSSLVCLFFNTQMWIFIASMSFVMAIHHLSHLQQLALCVSRRKRGTITWKCIYRRP